MYAFSEGHSMKLLNPFLIFIQFIFIFLILTRDARAENPSCTESVLPLESALDALQEQGGVWGRFSKFYNVRNHATVTLQLDSKVKALFVNLNHLCETQNGIQYDEIALVIVPLGVDMINNIGDSLASTGLLTIDNSLSSLSIQDISFVLRGIAALAISYGAFSSEVFRAGIQSIETGQIEAANSLGLNRYQSMRLIILPQAIRRVLPPLSD